MKQAEKAAMRAQARKDYLEGMSYRQIAAKYNVGIGSVSRWAEKDKWDPLDRNMNGTPKRNAGTERNTQEEPQEEPLQLLDNIVESEVPEDFDVLRESALLALERINEILRDGKALAPRDIKSITSALLDLKNQMNALSPRELREQALRLQALRKQAEDEDKPQEPVKVVFVNREWEAQDANA